jgi:cell division protease FtsH
MEIYMNTKQRMPAGFTWIGILLLFMIASFLFSNSDPNLNAVSFDKFKTEYRNGNVKEIEVRDDGMTIRGVLQDGTEFTTVASSERLDSFLAEEGRDDVIEKYTPVQTTDMWSIILPMGGILIVVGFLFFFMNQQNQQNGGGGGNRNVMNFGKSRAKMANPENKSVTFKEVAGAEEEKYELQEVVDFLKNPKKYIDLGARIPKGILLVGPPGTGKTLLAKAVAGEAGVPFFSISGSDFVEMFVGVGASRVRDMFDQAKKNSPCIIFIDEIDAVGRKRGAGLGGGHDEREQTLNQLLVEMDGFGINEGIIMVAATNRPDILDTALLRPGRFDRQIVVGFPDVKGREEILKVHVRNKPLADDIKLDVLAKMTSGFTGADLENLANEAALLAVRAGRKFITMVEMEEAITRVIAGTEKKSRIVSEKERKLTAYHEAGHAIIGRLMPDLDPVHQISIIPRGMAGGYTMHLPSEDRSYMSKTRLEQMMVSLLGGRVAEKLIIHDISTGAKNDIDRVSKIARSMVIDYGMSDVVGTISFGEGEEVFIGRDFSKSKTFSEKTGQVIDDEVKKLVDKAYEKAEELLSENLDKLHLVAQTLLEKEKIEADEFESLFTTGRLPEKKEQPAEPQLKKDQKNNESKPEERPVVKDLTGAGPIAEA